MKRLLAVAALACLTTAGCGSTRGARLEQVNVKDQVNGGSTTLTCVRWGGDYGSLSCDFTPLHPQPTVTVTVTAEP